MNWVKGCVVYVGDTGWMFGIGWRTMPRLMVSRFWSPRAARKDALVNMRRAHPRI